MKNNYNLKSSKNNCSEYSKSRRLTTFPIFSSNTDEKKQSIKVMGSFLDNYLPGLIANLSTCNVVDLGIGTGYFSTKVASYMHGVCNRKVIYEGIEIEQEFLNESRKLFTLERFNNKLILGNCFGDDIDQLVNQPALLISSQVIFYLNESNFDNFIAKVIQKTGLVAIIIAQAEGSYLNKVGQSYGDPEKKTNTEYLVDKAIDAHINFSHIKILYPSFIYFPPAITYAKLIEISSTHFTMLDQDSEDFRTRSLLEFVVGRKLEYLNCTGELEHFIGDTYNNIQLNGGNVQYWNYMTITVPKENMNQTSLKKELRKIHKLTLSGDITAFEASLNEGNYEIAFSLFKQGVVSCELHEYNYSFLKETFNLINSYIRYELRLYSGWPEFLKYFFNFDLDERINYRSYISPEILKMQSVKYNYSLKLDPSNPVDKVNNFVNSKGLLFREWMSNKLYEWSSSSLSSLAFIPFLFELGFASVFFYGIAKINPDSGLLLGLKMMYYSFWKQYFYTSSSAVHYIKGDDFLLQLYLFDQKNYDSLKFQNSIGQTALHKAILVNDTRKVDNLLSCSNLIVDFIINIRDKSGKLPLHNAVEQNNLKIVKKLLQRGADINSIIETSPLGYFFDFLFLGGKSVYLYAYFTKWNKKNDSFELIKLLSLSGLYALSHSFGLTLDILYHLAFLQRLNSYDDWQDSLSNLHKIYNGYSYNTALHLSTKRNYTEFSKFLISHQDIEINALNSKGETALHLAASNNNEELLDILLKSNISINHQTNNWSIYPIGDFLIKSFTLYMTHNTFLKGVCDLMFIAAVENEIFGSAHNLNSATALHYAIGGMNLSDTSFTSKKLEHNQNIKADIITQLIQNGADPDLTMNYHNSFRIQMIPYVTTMLISNFFGRKIPEIYRPVILFSLESLFSYSAVNIKPIDMLTNTSEKSLHKYLKQYTVMNKYTDSMELSWLNPKSLLYKLGLFSENDKIHMQDYGIYKGGRGKDTFYLYENFLKKDEGYSLIIKDYNLVEDLIICCNCDSSNTLEYKSEKLNKQNATILYFNDNPLVTLLGTDINHISEINFIFQESPPS